MFGQRVAGAQRRVLDEWRIGRERAGNREDRRQLFVVDLHQFGGFLGGIPGLGRDGRHRIAVVLGFASGDDRPIGELRAKARHRLGQVGRGHHEIGRRAGRAPPKRRSLECARGLPAR